MPGEIASDDSAKFGGGGGEGGLKRCIMGFKQVDNPLP